MTDTTTATKTETELLDRLDELGFHFLSTSHYVTVDGTWDARVQRDHTGPLIARTGLSGPRVNTSVASPLRRRRQRLHGTPGSTRPRERPKQPRAGRPAGWRANRTGSDWTPPHPTRRPTFPPAAPQSATQPGPPPDPPLTSVARPRFPHPERATNRKERTPMVDTTTETTLSHALRTAADLCDRIAYAESITWSGRSEIGLHAKTDEQYATLVGSLPGGSTRTMSGDDWEVDLYELPPADGLVARVYGPRRPLAEQQADR